MSVIGFLSSRSADESHFFSEALLPVSDPKMQRDPVPHLVRSLDLGLVIVVAEGAKRKS